MLDSAKEHISFGQALCRLRLHESLGCEAIEAQTAALWREFEDEPRDEEEEAALARGKRLGPRFIPPNTIPDVGITVIPYEPPPPTEWPEHLARGMRSPDEGPSLQERMDAKWHARTLMP